MISRSTIDRVMEASRIEEVVGDFVTLKKRGINFLGLCPFHNEKTPSFNVNPARGIYKCFGCGAAGNAVNFLMEHEHISYPEAIKNLAARYNIAVEEDEFTPTAEQQQQQSERDRLYQLHAFAQSYFAQYLQTDEGKAIGLSYFNERGINTQSLQLFGLGFAPEGYTTFSDFAQNSGYSSEELTAAGLSTLRDQGGLVDRFRGRVIFPFYNLSGKIIGFGGRILNNDKKVAKYLNSPETLLYRKSETLYGLFQAKKAIQKAENAYLVEGYTDVISLHQAGIEEVVASSGTSLTQEQARLIRRFSRQVTVLYDGDAAGIKASLRGIDILLEHDLLVRIVQMPEGEDPDSQCRKLGPQGFRNYLESEVKDFLQFKTEVLLHENADDPVIRAQAIHEIASSLACIADPILRSTYTTHTANLLKVEEQTLISEVNKQRLNKLKKQSSADQVGVESIAPEPKLGVIQQKPVFNDYQQEADIIRVLMHYGKEMMPQAQQLVVDFVTNELNEINWDHPLLERIFQLYLEGWTQYQSLPETHDLLNHPDKELAAAAASIYGKHYEMSKNWLDKHEIYVKPPQENIEMDVNSAVDRINLKKVHGLLDEARTRLKDLNTLSEEDQNALLQECWDLENIKIQLAARLGSIITR